MPKLEFDWEELDWEDEEQPLARRFEPPKLPARWLLGIVLTAAILLFGSWLVNLRRQSAAEATLINDVQTILDLEREAYLSGDGDLFFSLHINDGAWKAQQLRADNLRIIAAGQTVSSARQQGNEVWAEVSWQEGDQTYKRLLFFNYNSIQLEQTPTSEPYWGPWRGSSYGWGHLVVSRADEDFQDDVSTFVAAELKRHCADLCPQITVTLADDYGVSSLPNNVRIPSPRLVGLTEAGQPGPQFWAMLAERLGQEWDQVTIRFAVSAYLKPQYQRVVKAYHVHQDRIRVELVTFDELPADDLAMLELVDAAATTPRNNFNLLENSFTLTGEVIGAGAVVDLTNFALTDPRFAPGDFYEQIWQGGLWEERIWLVPQAAYMPVIFYDRAAYELADRPVPSLGWTWDEMLADMDALSEAQPGWIRWGLSDQRADLLYAYAYAQASNCDTAVVTGCPTILSAASRTAALTWYLELLRAADKGSDPHGPLYYPQGVNEFERLSSALQVVSSRRQAAFWVEDPVRFEYHLLLNSLGVLPFPASEQFDSSTPLWIYGNVISSASTQPLATWEWLRYLSFQRVNASSRHIPARPSIANRSNFWTSLPREIDNAMRTAFPFARPIPFIEQERFSWRQIDDLMNGDLTIEEASSQAPLRWFQTAQP